MSHSWLLTDCRIHHHTSHIGQIEFVKERALLPPNILTATNSIFLRMFVVDASGMKFLKFCILIHIQGIEKWEQWDAPPPPSLENTI
jgi:hypothetical protein